MTITLFCRVEYILGHEGKIEFEDESELKEFEGLPELQQAKIIFSILSKQSEPKIDCKPLTVHLERLWNA